MKKEHVVVILINFNSYRDTKDCVASIKTSTGTKPYIIIIDNDSKKAKDLEQLHSIYKKLQIIYNSNNVGFGNANNIGIQWVKENLEFEYLLLLNNDTLIESNTIEELIKPFRTDKAIGITTAKIFYEGNREIIWYGGGDIDYKRGWPNISDFNNEASAVGADRSRLVSFVSGCTMMFSKESIGILKGFDKEFFMYCEDLELCLRANKLGIKMYYTADSVVYHKVQASNNDSSFKGKRITGMRAGNPNLEFLFTNMKINQYRAMKLHRFSYTFLVNYWSRFVYKILKLVLKGRYDMLKVGFRVLKRNLR